MNYDFKSVEAKWQRHWDEKKTYHAVTGLNKPKYYVLVEFPYPSGSGLHCGHTPSQIAMDVVARYKRASGYNVLYPIGFDAFGLPAEQYAIKTKTNPADITKKNIEYFTKQIKSIGISFDWDRAFSTTDPDYFKWTQWLFLKFYEHGLAYKEKANINWCPNCKIGLSNEESEGGVCERCGTPVEQKSKEQWMLRMSDYAQKLLDGLDETNYWESIKSSQRNWIGKSEGTIVKCSLDTGDTFEIFTTCIETIMGITYFVLAPEHPLVSKLKDKITNYDEVAKYIDYAKHKSEFERGKMLKEKTGVELLGIHAIHPITKKLVPVFIGDYVLANYGTGAVMAVPTHDSRDFDFAKKFNLPMIEVISGGDTKNAAFEKMDYLNKGCKLVNSGIFNGLTVEEAKKEITDYLVKNNLGEKKVNYNLRDWIFSRQRYWGEPVPMIHCDKCGWVPVPYEDLPVLLPNVDHYEPSDDGESPLSRIDSFVNTTCPKCHGPAKRETDVMPNWAGSSWYYLRYMDPHNDKEFASADALKYWGMVDLYNGGGEHVTRHLLYARFWHRFFYDIGLVPYSEPFMSRVQQGLILAADGSKMSKSKGNTIDPMKYVEEYGADVARLGQMFMGDYTSTKPWSDDCMRPCQRLLQRIWNYREKLVPGEVRKDNLYNLSNCIKNVTEDIETLKFNTAISEIMILANYFDTKDNITYEEYKIILRLLCPFAPHMCNEAWEELKFEGSVEDSWPKYNESDLVQSSVEMVIQINSKIIARQMFETTLSDDEIKNLALQNAIVSSALSGKQIVKIIVVKDRLVNIIAK